MAGGGVLMMLMTLGRCVEVTSDGDHGMWHHLTYKKRWGAVKIAMRICSLLLVQDRKDIFQKSYMYVLSV